VSEPFLGDHGLTNTGAISMAAVFVVILMLLFLFLTGFRVPPVLGTRVLLNIRGAAPTNLESSYVGQDSSIQFSSFSGESNEVLSNKMRFQAQAEREFYGPPNDDEQDRASRDRDEIELAPVERQRRSEEQLQPL
jgi:hypothetical protein